MVRDLAACHTGNTPFHLFSLCPLSSFLFISNTMGNRLSSINCYVSKPFLRGHLWNGQANFNKRRDVTFAFQVKGKYHYNAELLPFRSSESATVKTDDPQEKAKVREEAS